MTEINEIAKKRIENIRVDCEKTKPLVAIRCITYNHEPYIRDALESFVMQKTYFPFVAIVHDDASTDGTGDIIREYAEKYPDIIKPIIETENQYSKHDGSLGRIINGACEATGAKYIAMCEGDDYWTDPLKLQKQVDFLESHPEYGMCYTRVKRYDQAKNKFIDIWGGYYETLEELLKRNTIPTLSVVLKLDYMKQYKHEIKPEAKKWSMGDIPLWLYIAANSKIYFLNEETGVYRILQKSASHPLNPISCLEFGLNGYNIHLFFANKYNRHTLSLYLKKYKDYFKFFIKRPHLIKYAIAVFKRNRYKKTIIFK